MADNYCVCEPYISGADAETITQGADFDLAEGVKAYDGYGNEIEYGYQPTELDTCEVGEHTVRYTAYGRGNRLVPQLCIPRGNSSLPSVCANDLEKVTEDRVITILQAEPPFFKGRGFNKNRLDPNTASDYEYGGLTWSFNEESGTVTVNGTYAKIDPEASDDGVFTVAFMPEIEDGDYILTGCPSGGSEDTYYIEWLYLDSNEEIHTGIETGEGVTLNGIASGLVVTIYVKSGVTVENLTFRPMLRLASVEDDTYEPYSGDSAMYIAPNTDFDPTDGVTATDANGNSVEYTYDGLYAEEASGDIASFETNVSAPLLSLLADIEPIQDLHGYDKPWTAGAGKNVLPYRQAGTGALGVTLTYDAEEEAYVLNGTTTGPGNIILDLIDSINWNTGEDYALSAEQVGGTMTIGEGTGITFAIALFSADYSSYIRGQTNNTSIDGYGSWGTSFDATNSRLILQAWRTGTVFNNFKFRVQIEKGKSITAWTPYSNICPISGHTKCVTEVCGVNVWDEEWESGKFDISTGAPVADVNYIRTKNYIPILPNTQYYYKAPSAIIYARFYFYDADKNFVLYDSKSTWVNGVFTTPTNAYYMKFILVKAYYGTTYNHDISINYPSTDTDYHAYQGNTYTTTLGRTVYGGKLDVVSGELVVDRAMVDLGTLNWTYGTWGGHDQFNATLTDAKSNGAGTLANMLSSAYSNVTPNNFYTGGADGTMTLNSTIIRIANSNYTDAASFKTAMNGVQLVYELATPQTIQLTPQEVYALLGENNVWADSGEVEVVYQMQIPQGEDYQYPLEGNYQLTYTAEDKCGNIGRGTRSIIVADETFRTVVYDDGTLIINESSYDTASNLVKHGAVKAVYDAMLEDGSNYIFNQNTPWTQNWTIANSITRVEIGSVIRPTSTAYWFYNLRMAEEFDLSKLDTSRVTDMNYMFGYVSYSLSSGSDVYLDLSHFDTSNVTNMSRMFDHAERLIEVDVSGFDTSNVNYLTRMFGYCNNLETIYASGAFSTGQLWDSTEMFADDYNLVGGNGTAYNSSHMNYEYARLDNPPTEPGYFTAKE